MCFASFLFFFTNCDVSCFIADAQPTESEKEMFLEVDSVLKKGQIILHEISQYRGASKEIREVNLISFLFCCTCKIPKFIPEKISADFGFSVFLACLS